MGVGPLGISRRKVNLFWDRGIFPYEFTTFWPRSQKPKIGHLRNDACGDFSSSTFGPLHFTPVIPLGRSELQILSLVVPGPTRPGGVESPNRRTGSLRMGQMRSSFTAPRLLALTVASESVRLLVEHVRVAPSRGIPDFALCPDPWLYHSPRIGLWAKTM